MTTVKRGSVIKGSSHKYLDAIKNNTLAPSHPRHHGVKMQAHHVLSEEGIRLSGLGKELETFGYDINTLDNLVFIPSTLKGACHLGVQPHRGNHTDEFDDDDAHPVTYHKYVSRKISELASCLRKECPGGDASKAKRVKNEMDKKGGDILSRIAKAPSTMKLTKVAQHFGQGNKVGCGGVDNVGTHRGQPCPCERNHQEGKEAAAMSHGQKSEGIKFPKPVPFYKLTMGK